MKIAVAMLCHKNIEQINALLRVMEHDDITFYVHVDKKSNIIRETIAGRNVYVLDKDNSVDIQWGSFGMVDATLRLIDTIYQSSQKYDYIWLMSGQDWPLRSANEIIEYIEQHYGEDFLEILSNEEAFERGYFKRNDLYYPDWMVSNKLYIKILKHIFWFLTGGRKSTRLFKRKSKIKNFYYGSQWWLLTSQTLNSMMQFLHKNKWFIDYFKNSLVPDECFFQTLYGMITSINEAKSSVCFVNWKSNPNSPEVFTSDDINKIKEIKNDYLVARKFDFCVDSHIVQKIRERSIVGANEKI